MHFTILIPERFMKWTKKALDELDNIAEYILKDSPKYADFLVK